MDRDPSPMPTAKPSREKREKPSRAKASKARKATKAKAAKPSKATKAKAAKPSKAKPSKAKPSKAKPSKAKTAKLPKGHPGLLASYRETAETIRKSSKIHAKRRKATEGTKRGKRRKPPSDKGASKAFNRRFSVGEVPTDIWGKRLAKAFAGGEYETRADKKAGLLHREVRVKAGLEGVETVLEQSHFREPWTRLKAPKAKAKVTRYAGLMTLLVPGGDKALLNGVTNEGIEKVTIDGEFYVRVLKRSHASNSPEKALDGVTRWFADISKQTLVEGSFVESYGATIATVDAED